MSFGNWYWQPNLKDGENAKSGIREVIALQTILITVALALLVYSYQKDFTPLWRSVITYICISLIPLTLLFCMLRLRSRAHSRTPAFDRSTIMFTRCSFWFSAVMVFVLAVLFMQELLPRPQPPTPTYLFQLPVYEVVNYEDMFPKYTGKPRLLVYVRLNKEGFPSGIPQTIRLQVTLDSRLTEDWQLVGSYGLDGKLSEGQKRPVTCVSKSDCINIQNLEIDNLYPDAKYTLLVPVESKQDLAKDRGLTKKQLKNAGGITVSVEAFQVSSLHSFPDK